MITPQIQNKVIVFNYISIKLVDVNKILFCVKIHRQVEIREEIVLKIKYVFFFLDVVLLSTHFYLMGKN